MPLRSGIGADTNELVFILKLFECFREESGNDERTAMPNKLPPDDEAQSKRFIDTANEYGADKDSAGFEKVVRAVIPPKPMKNKQSGKPPANLAD